MIKNPVLSGFHPDPSMICVDGVFYIANSTFEYYPGVKISRSTDLANWETVCYPCIDQKHIDLKGNPASAGVWAPCLTYNNGTFYLVYTDVKTWSVDPFKDTLNYIITTTDLKSEWSEPVYINSSGFDPSLFHDDDGRKYFVNMEWDYRTPHEKNFTGILLTELDQQTLKPISKSRKIWTGSERGLTEGPHLYKRNGWYYLFVAEGGTSYNHAETVARSRNINGPYEVHPNKHLICAEQDPKHPLQKTGHASLCQHPDGRWWLAFLCGRPIDAYGNCPLGRETGIAEVVWTDDWPYLKVGGMLAPEYFEGYGEKKINHGGMADFKNRNDMLEFQSLRVPAEYQVLENGALRLYGKESLYSTHRQNMLVRRQDCRNFTAIARVRFDPESFRHMAGLIYRYNEENQYYLRIGYNEKINSASVGLLSVNKFIFQMIDLEHEIPVTKDHDVWLKVEVNGKKAFFSCSMDGLHYIDLPFAGDVSILSDEQATPQGFTGAFVGMACQDLEEQKIFADFISFSYVRGNE